MIVTHEYNYRTQTDNASINKDIVNSPISKAHCTQEQLSPPSINPWPAKITACETNIVDRKVYRLSPKIMPLTNTITEQYLPI